jgi:hypothetical protein
MMSQEWGSETVRRETTLTKWLMTSTAAAPVGVRLDTPAGGWHSGAMRVAVVLVLMASSLTAQEPDLPGTPVSRPLTVVEEPPPLAPPLPAQPLPASPVPDTIQELPPEVLPEATVLDRPLPGSWSHYDFLLSWSKAQPLPLLATRNGLSAVGGSSIGANAQAGFRFGMGWSSNPERDAGWEFEGLFLGTRVGTLRLTDGEIRRPFTNPTVPYAGTLAGTTPDLVVNGAGFATGSVVVTTTTRVQGWEVIGVKSLLDAGDIKFNALGGYRYLGVNEGLHVHQQSLYAARLGQPATLWGVYDQFDARNNFHGGQVGFVLDYVGQRWTFGLRTTVALGSNFETVQARGNSSATTAALPVLAVQPYSAGFLATASNSGRALESRFAVLPEARVTLGYRLGERCQVMAGYDFLYLSNAVRPGDQVDPTVNPAQVPILGGVAGPALFGPARPAPLFNRTDFWVQGLVLGFDCRY